MKINSSQQMEFVKEHIVVQLLTFQISIWKSSEA